MWPLSSATISVLDSFTTFMFPSPFLLRLGYRQTRQSSLPPALPCLLLGRLLPIWQERRCQAQASVQAQQKLYRDPNTGPLSSLSD
ncbi:MAG: AAAP family amino acid transporter [Caudoviricetes sp.]|nr:MAG: AAAP family amino acid transporter [Caudoviricetes sp.]